MLLLSALAILFTWTILALVLIGLGSLVLRRFDTDFLLLDAFWLGLAVSVVLLELWNFFRPVDPAIAILLCVAAAAGLFENRTPVSRWITEALSSSRWLTLLYVAMVLFLAFRASGPCDYFDTGLYGWQAVHWIQAYPVVPGLANVHGRFGLDSSVFLCVAALSQGVWRGLGFHLFTGFLIAAMGFTLLPACLRLAQGSSASAADWFYGILAIPIGSWAFREPIVGTETDQPATIVCLVAVGMLFEEFCRQAPGGDQKPGHARLVVASSLFTLAVTFKESTVVFAVLAWCLSFWLIWSGLRSLGNRGRSIVVPLALSTLIVVPWLARGIVLSGYAFFPSAAFGFPVDWKTPVAVAHWYVAAIKFWGHTQGGALPDTQGLAWLRLWLNRSLRDRTSFQVPLLIGLCGFSVALALRVWKEIRSTYTWLWLLLPSVTGFVFWFILSPDLRFGQPAIWTTAGTLGTWGTVLVVSGPRRAQITRAALAGVLVLLIWCLIGFGWKEPYRRLLVAPPLGPLPEVSVTAHQTLSGLTVFVPAHGDQCWDAPLPCTPYFDETLRLRNPKSMRFGFTSDSQGTQLPRFQAALGSLGILLARQPSDVLTFQPANAPHCILSPCPLVTSKSRASATTGMPVRATSVIPPPLSAPGNTSTR